MKSVVLYDCRFLQPKPLAAQQELTLTIADQKFNFDGAATMLDSTVDPCQTLLKLPIEQFLNRSNITLFYYSDEDKLVGPCLLPSLFDQIFSHVSGSKSQFSVANRQLLVTESETFDLLNRGASVNFALESVKYFASSAAQLQKLQLLADSNELILDQKGLAVSELWLSETAGLQTFNNCFRIVAVDCSSEGGKRLRNVLQCVGDGRVVNFSDSRIEQFLCPILKINESQHYHIVGVSDKQLDSMDCASLLTVLLKLQHIDIVFEQSTSDIDSNSMLQRVKDLELQLKSQKQQIDSLIFDKNLLITEKIELFRRIDQLENDKLMSNQQFMIPLSSQLSNTVNFIQQRVNKNIELFDEQSLNCQFGIQNTETSSNIITDQSYSPAIEYVSQEQFMILQEKLLSSSNLIGELSEKCMKMRLYTIHQIQVLSKQIGILEQQLLDKDLQLQRNWSKLQGDSQLKQQLKLAEDSLYQQSQERRDLVDKFAKHSIIFEELKKDNEVIRERNTILMKNVSDLSDELAVVLRSKDKLIRKQQDQLSKLQQLDWLANVEHASGQKFDLSD